MVCSNMKKLKFLFFFFSTWFLLHELIIIVGGLTAKPEKSEYAVILGNTVNPDGSLSARLQARLDKGLQLYQDSLAAKLFLSGGLGKEGHYEAEKMADYLLAQGVLERDILIDNNGNTTWLTAVNFKERVHNSKGVIVVSQYFHLSRVKLAFKKNGVTSITAACPSYYEFRDIYAAFREFFAYYKYLLFA